MTRLESDSPRSDSRLAILGALATTLALATGATGCYEMRQGPGHPSRAPTSGYSGGESAGAPSADSQSGEGRPGLGTVWGEQTARRLLAEAGFGSVEAVDAPGPQNTIFICRR